MATKTAQQNTAPLVRAHARSLRIAPRKMRLVTNLVKNMRVADALTQLQFTNKKGAKMLSKLLLSAIANAEHNFSLNRDNLYIKSITCDMGPVMQRSFPRARGSAFIIRHKLSHVNVVLEDRPSKTKKAKATVPAVKKSTKTEAKPKTQDTKAKIEKKPKKAAAHHENEASNVDDKTSPEILKK